MQEIPLIPIPNQRLSVVLEEAWWDITLNVLDNGAMVATIARDNTVLIEGVRVMPYCPLLPYDYQEAGNFALVTSGGEYPNYTKFGDAHKLIFASAAEIAEIRSKK